MATNKSPHNNPSLVEFHPQHLHHHHRPNFLPSQDHLAPPHHRQHHHPQGPMQPSSSSSPSSAVAVGNPFHSKDAGAYDLGELDQALFLYLDGHDPSSSSSSSLHQDQKREHLFYPFFSQLFLLVVAYVLTVQQQTPSPIIEISTEFHARLITAKACFACSSLTPLCSSVKKEKIRKNLSEIQSGMRPPSTLNIFPSQPFRANPSTKVSSGGLVSPGASGLKRQSETTTSLELANQRTDTNHINNNNNNKINNSNVVSAPPAEPAKTIKREGNRKGPGRISEHDGLKTTDPKTLRRLAQNREAARKSRLRKKAYIQQLESSRVKLTQLEQELHRARSQGILIGGGPAVEQALPIGIGHVSADAAIFDMEYARWLEEHHRLMCELRAALQERLPENELQLFVENGLAHYNEMMNLKGMVAKSDVFHLVSGMWMTPTERCFMWLGGFRPSELVKVIMNHIEPLTEQQIMGVCGLQQSTQEAEEALSQGLEALNQSLSDTISSDSLSYPTDIANYMGQMAAAMDKLSTLECFIRQADGLRHQTIHRLHQILMTHQFARCLLAIAEYFHRLRALSSLWLSRPRQD